MNNTEKSKFTGPQIVPVGKDTPDKARNAHTDTVSVCNKDKASGRRPTSAPRGLRLMWFSGFRISYSLATRTRVRRTSCMTEAHTVTEAAELTLVMRTTLS